MAKLIKSLWAGEVSLGEAFWSYAIAYGLLLNVITSFLFMMLLVHDAAMHVLALAFALPLPYNLLVIVAVWRSADRYTGPKQRAELARLGTVLWMLALTAA